MHWELTSAFMSMTEPSAAHDTFATAGILAAAVKKIQDVDLVICGKQAIDGDTAQVGPEMAEILGLPHVAYVKKIREVTESEVVCEREIETGVEVIRVKLPAVLTVLKDINVPRLPSYRMKMEGKEKETPVWGIATWACRKIRLVWKAP